MNKQPLLILTLCFILGIFFQDKLILDKISIYVASAGCILILLSFLFHSYYLHRIRAFLLGLMFFGAGIILHFFNSFSSDHSSVPQHGMIIFKISKKLNSTEKYKKYEGLVSTGKENFNAVLYLPKKDKELDLTIIIKQMPISQNQGRHSMIFSLIMPGI